MTQGMHYIISETTEDRFDESDSLEGVRLRGSGDGAPGR